MFLYIVMQGVLQSILTWFTLKLVIVHCHTEEYCCLFTWFIMKLVIVHCHAGEYWFLYSHEVSKKLLMYIVRQGNTDVYTHMIYHKTCYCTLSRRGILVSILTWSVKKLVIVHCHAGEYCCSFWRGRRKAGGSIPVRTA